MIAMVAVTALIVAALVITNATAGDDVSIAPDTWFAPDAQDQGAAPVEAIESPQAVIARLDPPGEPALVDRFDRDRIDGVTSSGRRSPATGPSATTAPIGWPPPRPGRRPLRWR